MWLQADAPVLSTPGPLSPGELSQLEATLLPALERHHLRLLAHALRTLQQVQQQAGNLHLPEPAAIEQWLLEQPSLDQDPDFRRQLAVQLSNAGRQLEELAVQRGVAPLALELEALINWAQQQANQRLATTAVAAAVAAAPPTEPPGPPARH